MKEKDTARVFAERLDYALLAASPCRNGRLCPKLPCPVRLLARRRKTLLGLQPTLRSVPPATLRCGTTDRPRQRRMNPEQLLLESLPDLERIAAFVCRKSNLLGADADDFHSWVRLKLIENDYAILRKFEGRSSFRTYLAVVVQRLMLDFRNHQLGKWRPSAEARRMGEVAVTLERLLHRDRRTADEAVAITGERHAVSRTNVEDILLRLPQRAPRRREVPLDELPADPATPAEQVEREAVFAETEMLARKAGDVIREAIDAMPESDRLVLRLRFEAGMSVVEIARALRTESAPLYRRMYRSLDGLRARLEKAGVRAAEALRLVDSSAELDFGLASVPRPVADEEARA